MTKAEVGLIIDIIESVVRAIIMGLAFYGTSKVFHNNTSFDVMTAVVWFTGFWFFWGLRNGRKRGHD